MQGRKNYQEQLFTSFQLSDRVPQDNFYRRLKETLDLTFLYKETAKYYGTEGQKSIDPVVFFKLMLVGYLENQPSDRRIIATSSMRMDILYFIGYNIDEELPWHSTLSRTRQLYEESIFVDLFKLVLKQCVEKGMLSGRRQAVDSVLVKANASMESLIDIHGEVTTFSKQITANEQDQPEDKDQNQDHHQGQDGASADQESDKKLSNKTRRSTTDPGSRMAVKPGKALKLNYLAQVSVDTSSHVITHIEAFHADKKDNQCLDKVLSGTINNLAENDLTVEEVLADANYSSSDSLQKLKSRGIRGYIPNTGSYKAERQGFEYDQQNDLYYCSQGKPLGFVRYRLHHGYSKVYQSERSDCKDCPLKESCIGRSSQKTITTSVSKPLFEQMHQRINSSMGRAMMRIRKSTVEPVIGTLVEYTGMKKVHTKGIKLANKCMLLAAISYNLKKLMKYKAPEEILKKLFKQAPDMSFTVSLA